MLPTLLEKRAHIGLLKGLVVLHSQKLSVVLLGMWRNGTKSRWGEEAATG